MKSRVMVQVADRRIEPDEHEVPPVGPGEALLRVEACGLCGSDVEQYRGNFAAKGIMRYPVIPGHEPVGRIAEIGKEAARSWGVSVGDRVALEPHLSCGRCELCLGGAYHNCRSLMPPGAPPCYGYTPRDVGHGLWGGYSEYIHLHERTMLHRVPETMPLALALLYQPIAAGIRWAVQAPATAMGDTVLILGHGQRGLGAVVAAREAGASTIVVTGTSRSAYKLRLAEALGADHTIEADREDTVERVMAITGGRGVDVALDVVGRAPRRRSRTPSRRPASAEDGRVERHQVEGPGRRARCRGGDLQGARHQGRLFPGPRRLCRGVPHAGGEQIPAGAAPHPRIRPRRCRGGAPEAEPICVSLHPDR